MTEVLEMPYPEEPEKKPDFAQMPAVASAQRQEDVSYPDEEIDLSGFTIETDEAPLLAAYQQYSDVYGALYSFIQETLAQGVLDEPMSRRLTAHQQAIKTVYANVVQAIVGAEGELETRVSDLATFWANDEETRNKVFFELNGHYVPNPSSYPHCLDLMNQTIQVNSEINATREEIVKCLSGTMLYSVNTDIENMIDAINERSRVLREQAGAPTSHAMPSSEASEAVTGPHRLKRLGNSLVRIAELGVGIALGITVADQLRKHLRS